MKQTTGKIYICDYCGRKIVNPGACAVHEKHCRKNPRNIHLCMRCKYLEVSTELYIADNGMHQGEHECKAFRCRIYDKYMYTYRKRDLGEKAGIEVYIAERGETFQCEEMPTEVSGGCEKYKNYVLARFEQ